MKRLNDEMTRREAEMEKIAAKAESYLAEEMRKFHEMRDRENISEVDTVKIDWYNIDFKDNQRKLLLLKMVSNWVQSMHENLDSAETAEILKGSVRINGKKKAEIILNEASAPPLQTLLGVFKDDLSPSIIRRLQNIVVQTESFSFPFTPVNIRETLISRYGELLSMLKRHNSMINSSVKELNSVEKKITSFEGDEKKKNWSVVRNVMEKWVEFSGMLGKHFGRQQMLS